MHSHVKCQTGGGVSVLILCPHPAATEAKNVYPKSFSTYVTSPHKPPTAIPDKVQLGITSGFPDYGFHA